MRCAGNLTGGDAADFDELVHEVFLGVEAPGGIDEDEVAPPRARGGDGIKNDGAGVGAFLSDERGMAAGAFGPDFDLLGGGGAKGVGSGKKGFSARGRTVAGGKLYRRLWFCRHR